MDYAKIVLAHRIIVSLFLLHYVVKIILLLMNKDESLQGYTAKTKVVEMILSVLFLVSGIYLAVAGPAITTLQIVKLVFVFASIPIAVIGFKKKNKVLAVLSVVLLIMAYGFAEMAKKQRTKIAENPVIEQMSSLEIGKQIYSQNCIACHGEKGDAQLAGAKNLRETTLTDVEQKDIIKNGKGTMQAYQSLTDQQLDGIVTYIKTLK